MLILYSGFVFTHLSVAITPCWYVVRKNVDTQTPLNFNHHMFPDIWFFANVTQSARNTSTRSYGATQCLGDPLSVVPFCSCCDWVTTAASLGSYLFHLLTTLLICIICLRMWCRVGLLLSAQTWRCNWIASSTLSGVLIIVLRAFIGGCQPCCSSCGLYCTKPVLVCTSSFRPQCLNADL